MVNIIKEKYKNESKINDLKSVLEYFKDKFNTLITFLYRKLHSWYDKNDKCIDAVNDIYDNKEILKNLI